jgi:hypothetical protein
MHIIDSAKKLDQIYDLSVMVDIYLKLSCNGFYMEVLNDFTPSNEVQKWLKSMAF